MIPIDEQILNVKSVVDSYVEHGDHLNAKAYGDILASLERLKKIDEVQVPDEPDAVKYLREKFGDGSKGFVRLWDGRAIAIVNLIDTLRDLLRKETVRGDQHLKVFVYEAERADKLQAKLAAIEKMGREPSAGMKQHGKTAMFTGAWESEESEAAAIFTAMFAKMMEELK
jgi:hypothetical protein